MTSEPPRPSIVSAPEPPVIVLAPLEPTIEAALDTRLASTFWKSVSVVPPDTA